MRLPFAAILFVVLHALSAIALAVPLARAGVPQPDTEITEEFTIPAFDGDARLTLRRTMDTDTGRQYSAMNSEALKRAALAWYAGQYPGITLVGTPRVSKHERKVELLAEYAIPRPLVRNGDLHELPVAPALVERARQALGALQSGDRAGASFHGVHRLRIVWPAAARANDMPAALTIAGQYFYYRRDLLQRSNVTELRAEFRMTGHALDQAGMPTLRAELQRFADSRIAAIGVSDRALMPDSLAKVPFRTAEAYLAALELARDIAALPAGDVPVPAGCRALHAALLAGELAPPTVPERLGAVARALAARPERDGVRRCVGSAWLLAGDAAGAVRVLGAGKQYPDEHALNRLLAWARLLAGDRAGAVDLMLRHDAARVAAGSDTVHDLIRAAALLQVAGRDLPPGLQARLAARDEEFWPGPVARMQAGLIGADELLASAAALEGDARAFALAEAHFHVAAARGRAGDQQGARRSLRYVQANAAHSTFEYLLARGMLPEPPASGHTAGANVATLRANADAYDSAAMAALGRRLVDGDGVPRDVAEGLVYLRQAAALGHRAAQAGLGQVLMGYAPEEAAVWNTLLAGQGDVAAQLRVVQQVQRGAGVPRDPERALAMLLPIAERGQADAQTMLAMMYHVERDDPAAAASWYRKAAAQGIAIAMTNLGDMYENGHGVPRDLAQAVALYRQAARVQDHLAFASLGNLYEQGNGVPRDPVLAYTCYLLAQRFGWQDERPAALARALSPAQMAAARAAAQQWTKEAPLPGT